MLGHVYRVVRGSALIGYEVRNNEAGDVAGNAISVPSSRSLS